MARPILAVAQRCKGLHQHLRLVRLCMRLGFCSYYDSFLFCTNKRYRQTFLPRLNRSSILSYPCSNNSHSLSQALIEPSMIDFHTSPIFSVVFIWLVFLGWGLGFNFNCIPFFKTSNYPMRRFCVFKSRVPSRTFITLIPSIFAIKNVNANKSVITKTISSKSFSAFRNYGKLIFVFARLNRGEFGCRCCFLHTTTLP